MVSNEDLINTNKQKSNEQLMEEVYSPKIEKDLISIQHDIDAVSRRIADFKVEGFYKTNGSRIDNEARGFERESQAITYVIDIAKHIRDTHQRDIIKLPPSVLMEIFKHLAELDNLLRKMRNFHEEAGLERSDAYKDDELLKEKDVLVHFFYKSFEKLENSAAHLINMTSISHIKSLQEVVNNLVDENTEEGIETHHELFSTHASKHYWAGWFWLVIGSLASFMAWSFGEEVVLKIDALSAMKDATNIQVSLVVIRIFLFGFLASLVFWSFKNYRLNKHNELLNTQKAMSIKTFREFSNAASTDVDMRRAILTKVTSTIFDMPNMGYISNNSASDTEQSIVNALSDLLVRKEIK